MLINNSKTSLKKPSCVDNIHLVTYLLEVLENKQREQTTEKKLKFTIN